MKEYMVEYINLIIGVIAAIVAILALRAQIKEIKKSGQINSLIYTAELIQQKIDFYSVIIEDNKNSKQYKEYKHLTDKINNELRPLKEQINNEFLNIASKYDGVLHEDKIRKLLKLENIIDKSENT